MTERCANFAIDDFEQDFEQDFEVMGSGQSGKVVLNWT